MDMSEISEKDKELAKDRARKWMAEGCPDPGSKMCFEILSGDQ